VAAAFAVRFVYALTFAPDVSAFGDDAFYHQAALHLADGLGYKEGFFELRPTAAHPPLYPYALSAIAWLGGHSVDAQRLLGVCAGTGTVLIAGLIATRVAGRRAGLIAAVLCAAYPGFIAADAALMSETVFGLLVAGAMLQALRQLEAPSAWGMALLGALIGAAALTRSEGLLLAAPALVLAVLAVPRHGQLLRAAALIGAVLLLVGPWVARNHHLLGRFLYTTNEGTTLAGSNCRPTYYGKLIGGFTTDCLPSFPQDANLGDVTNERRQAAFRYIKRHRGRAAVVAGLRVLRIWGFYGVDDQTRLEGRERGMQTAALVSFYALLGLGLGGVAILYGMGSRAQLAILLSPPAVATLTAALTYGLPRLRHIADISVVILAGVATTAAARALRPARTRATRPCAPPAAPRA
jgi:hypothetical protein